MTVAIVSANSGPEQAYARPVAEPLRTLDTPDGRTLAFAVWGDRDGFPILGLHGTPGCRLERWPHEELYTELGVCLVTHDRAGYGQSDRRRGRSVADEVDDVRSLADELGFDRFGVTGGSGGGPHALACAALLPDRVVRATCRVGVAPLGDAGLTQDEWLAGMDGENVKEFGWALAGEEVLTRELEAEDARIKERVAVDPSTALEGFDLSEADRAQMARPDMMQITRESTAERSSARRRRLGRRRSLVPASRGGSTLPLSPCPCSSGTERRTCSCLPPTASGSPRTFPAVLSRSTPSRGTWA